MIVIGLGNPLRCDDNIGNYLAEKNGGIAAETTPENVIGKIKHEKKIVFIDAVEFPGRVGEVRLFDLDEIAAQLATTHSLPVGMLSKLVNGEIKVIGIKVKDHGFGKEFSEEIKQKLPVIEEEVETMLRTFSE